MTKLVLTVVFVIGVLMMMPHAAAAQGPRKSVSAAEVNGTYRMNFRGKFSGDYNEIRILALGRGKLRVAMDLTYPYTMPNGDLSANVGTLDSETSISGDIAIYESNEFGPCKITIKFVRPGTIKVTQDGSDARCGFGNNVISTGTYQKVSNKKPSFDRSI